MFIYNSNGQLVKQLLRNHIMGTEGTVNWDGVTTDNAIAPIGIYIVWMEVFNLNGDVQRVKKAFVLAGKL
jgi:flagellar hook assembly protein FlgD